MEMLCGSPMLPQRVKRIVYMQICIQKDIEGALCMYIFTDAMLGIRLILSALKQAGFSCPIVLAHQTTSYSIYHNTSVIFLPTQQSVYMCQNFFKSDEAVGWWQQLGCIEKHFPLSSIHEFVATFQQLSVINVVQKLYGSIDGYYRQDLCFSETVNMVWINETCFSPPPHLSLPFLEGFGSFSILHISILLWTI